MELLSKIEDLVNGEAKFSEKENRIYVQFIGIRNASALKQFMSDNGFVYVYGQYVEGIYELGFSKGEGN